MASAVDRSLRSPQFTIYDADLHDKAVREQLGVTLRFPICGMIQRGSILLFVQDSTAVELRRSRSAEQLSTVLGQVTQILSLWHYMNCKWP